jgi:hypothetical protein
MAMPQETSQDVRDDNRTADVPANTNTVRPVVDLCIVKALIDTFTISRDVTIAQADATRRELDSLKAQIAASAFEISIGPCE